MNRDLTNQILHLNHRKFSIQEVIGRGASCVVYRAVCPDNTEHLLKEYNPRHIAMYREDNGELCLESEEDREAFEAGLARFREGHALQRRLRLDSDLKNSTSNIQEIYSANGTEYIDMTCFSGQSYEKVREKSVYDLMRRMKALTQVIGNYHKAGLLHLDIKPHNIFTIPETCELVMLFDFDSVVTKETAARGGAHSYSKDWSAPEQRNPLKRRNICEATDLFAVGEIIFWHLMGRNSAAEDHRSFATYTFEHNAPIFENVNPKVFPLLDELFHHTICARLLISVTNVQDLIAKLDAIIKIADPKEPYLKSSTMSMQDFFIGRDGEIQEIHDKLSENRILFLSGIGGIGKSELAKHYAATHKADYDAIIFAPYVSNVNMLIADDIAIPIYNFQPYPEERPQEYCSRKLRKLRELCDERTLLIVDNLDSDEDPDVPKLLELGCKLLITTRMDFSDYGLGQFLYIDALRNKAEIRDIFGKYYTNPLSADEESCVERIIDLVAGHTMTVELLAKQMMAGRVKPDKMLAKMQEGGIGETGKEKVHSGKDGSLAAQSTYAHIQALFGASELNEDEQYILANLSLIPYAGISTELFSNWCELEDYRVLNFLVNFGYILTPATDVIALHPVISEYVLAITSKSSDVYDKLLSHAKEWVSDPALQGLDAATLKSRVDIVYYIAKKILSLNVETEVVASFLNRVPTVFWKYGKLTDAIACRKRALKIRLCLFGEVNSDTATSYFNLGRTYKESDDYERAEECYKKALEIRQTLPKEEPKDIASCYHALGTLYKEKKIFGMAEEYERKALQIRMTLLVKKDKDVASSYNSLAVLYMEMEEFEESERHHLLALDIRKYLFGEMHEDVATSLNNLGKLYRKWGKLNEAEIHLLKALDIRQSNFIGMHLYTADTHANLGDLYRERKEYGSALTHYQEALKMRTALLGETHSKTVRVKKKIAKLPEGPTRFAMRQEKVRIIIENILESYAQIKTDYFSKARCPDQLVAKIRISRKMDGSFDVEYIECCKTKHQRKSDAVSGKDVCNRKNLTDLVEKNDCARIVLILESPHKNEFNPNNHSKPTNGPAYGITGDNINAYLPKILLREAQSFLCAEGCIDYEVVLVNAVQYQCSLGENTRKYRDKVFWECWQRRDLRADFCERVKSALGNNVDKSILINCCTTGNLLRSNHELVNMVLEDMELSFYESSHPFGWTDANNREIRPHKYS